MAEAAAAAKTDHIDINKEWAEGTLDEACKWIADTVVKISDSGDFSKNVSDQGKIYFVMFYGRARSITYHACIIGE